MRISAWLMAGLTLLALSVIWHFTISPRWQQRFPNNWQQEFNFIGISTTPDPATNQFPPKDNTGVYQRLFEVIDRQPTSVTVQDNYIIRDPSTQEIIFHYTFSAEIDPQTGEHLNPELQGDYYLFPRNVEKETYRIRHSYIKSIPLAFQWEEEIEGLTTYYFSYHGPAEYTESYTGFDVPEDEKIQPGQELRCADDQFRLNMWVEPLTGEILKIDESCYAGDYIFDVATNQPIIPVLRWGAVTAGDDVQRRSDQVRMTRTSILWATRYVPLLILGIGSTCLAIYAIHRQNQQQAERQLSSNQGPNQSPNQRTSHHA